ncbi:hypothetical protein [Synechococcus sp. UW179B]|nr:hypothetical protein [Synechococcus sp. UW179B]
MSRHSVAEITLECQQLIAQAVGPAPKSCSSADGSGAKRQAFYISELA